MNDRAAANIIEMVQKALEEQGSHRLDLDGESTLNLIQEIGDYLPLNIDVLEEQEYEKPYMAFWGDGYEDAPMVDEEELSFFTEGNGYSPADIKKIEEMQVDEILDLTDQLSNIHLIKRLR